MFKGLLKSKITFAVIAVSLLLAGSTMKIKLPRQIANILKNDVIKVALLIAILYLGKVAIQYSFIAAILFIIFVDKLNDNDIENFTS